MEDWVDDNVGWGWAAGRDGCHLGWVKIEEFKIIPSRMCSRKSEILGCDLGEKLKGLTIMSLNHQGISSS